MAMVGTTRKTLSPQRMFRKVAKRILNKSHKAVRCFSSEQCESPPIAVVLSGCGPLDGSEIHEAASILSHITRQEATPFVFAPATKQNTVVDHSTGQPGLGSRWVNIESARIARAAVKRLIELVNNLKKFHAVIFPGGLGVVTTLSDFAQKGRECVIDPEVVAVIEGCHKNQIALGFACIAPILAARVLCNPTITLGNTTPDSAWPYQSAIGEAIAMGATIELRGVNDITIDHSNKVYSTPSYMYKFAKYHEVDDGIGKMIQAIVTDFKHR